MKEDNFIPKVILGGGLLFFVLCIISCFVSFSKSLGIACGVYAALYVGWVSVLLIVASVKKEWSLTKQGLVSFYIIVSILTSILRFLLSTKPMQLSNLIL